MQGVVVLLRRDGKPVWAVRYERSKAVMALLPPDTASKVYYPIVGRDSPRVYEPHEQLRPGVMVTYLETNRWRGDVDGWIVITGNPF
jgi:hypothetical protein